MNQTEFLIDLSAVPSEISTNIAEIKAWLTETLAPYKNLLVTEDTLADAKSVRAKVNNLQKQISTQRINFKKQYLAPFDRVELEIKSLEGICTEISTGIGNQINEFDERRKQAKVNALYGWFEENNDCGDYLTWENVLNPKWSNVTYSDDGAKEEMQSAISKTKADIDAIRGMESEWEAALLTEYKQNHDIAAIIRKEAELKRVKEAETKRKEAELERRMAELAAKVNFRKEEAAAIPPSAPVKEGVIEAETEYKPIEASVTEADTRPARPNVRRVNFWVEGTPEQLSTIGYFLKQNNIRYGAIK